MQRERKTHNESVRIYLSALHLSICKRSIIPGLNERRIRAIHSRKQLVTSAQPNLRSYEQPLKNLT